MTLYLDSLQPLLPDDIRKQLDHALLPEIKAIVDAMLRLVVGAEAPASGVLPGWEDLQPRASKIVDDLKRGENRPSQKRARDDDNASSSKRARTDSGVPSAEDDPRVFSLQGISVSTPIRKKVNIDVHGASIRLTNPSSQKEEFPPIPLSVLQRAFLLPTRGKSKAHWTVVLLSSDVPPLVPKGPGAAAAAKETTQPQLVFGLDATLTSVLNTSTRDSDKTYMKGQPSLPALRAFFSHLPIPALEPSTRVFKSVAGSQEGDGVAGVEAYRGAKEGTLWFLDGGVLWDGKPCEFFALEHLAPASKDNPPIDGLRTLSATGRTCSVIMRRIGGGNEKNDADAGAKGKAKANGGGGAEEDDEENEEEVAGVEIDFNMVDGREQEPIGRWVKARRHLFGRVSDPASSSASAGADGAAGSSTDKGKGKARTHEEDPRAEDTEDEEDSDFAIDTSTDEDSSDDGESDSDASQDGGEGNEEDEGGNASDDATGDEMDVEDEDEEKELDPKHHPLLRPGAMPRMSRAAVEAVVGMVEKDMAGGGRAAAVDSEEDEEDELED
ncbi:hypothetical protein L226DRAFT_534837 [Lentinus tigrinus ALCF2SS1-7]|uniref:Histone chaperone RTT106/FACT complex subunit SPT16-like middle domain-containing protein n=1 Tax=Lentinus tigrinus ALCF2SS1-6 TaxID=1328759 RepID=A0A5C2SBN8_9APHY|nr:hypothetical protein L227DRAFT_574808 [Lentinus tigrinus ALCF2SS1-6]RPD75264.1 hypothetical protein L226DRAFT_534837 [Lentinus tigrinus ALCF2SS1-7]